MKIHLGYPLKAVLFGFSLLAVVPTASAVNLLDFIPDDEESALLTTGLDSDRYLADAIANGDGEIILPRGTLRFHQTVHVKPRIHLIGQGGGQEGTKVTKLIFAPDTTGFVIHRSNTGAKGIEAPGGAADGSIIEGVHIQGSGNVGDGIWLRARATIRQTTIDGFGGNCVKIYAAAVTTDPFAMGNANNWIIDSVRLTRCKNGLSIDGPDVNAGTSTAVDASHNREYGILDSSFLGNTHIGSHAEANGLGPYKTDDPNARIVFVGCYSEGGQPPASLVRPTLVLGGLHGAGITGTAQIIGQGEQTGFAISSQIPSGRATSVLNSIYPDVPLNLGVSGDHPTGWQFPMWNENLKLWDMRWARLDGKSVLQFTTGLTPLRDEAGNLIGAGEIILPRGFWVLSNTVPGRYRKVMP
jgi:hypothetical protein